MRSMERGLTHPEVRMAQDFCKLIGRKPQRTDCICRRDAGNKVDALGIKYASASLPDQVMHANFFLKVVLQGCQGEPAVKEGSPPDCRSKGPRIPRGITCHTSIRS